MRKLKLIKPWALSAVRQKLAARPTFPGQYDMQAPAPVATEPAALRHTEFGRDAMRLRCETPYERSTRRGAPERRPIFASTASPHPGCPHLFS